MVYRPQERQLRMHTVGVCGVVQNAAGQVLLVRTARAGWELPGGRVEAGEDLVQALGREVREETGYVLAEVGGLRAVSCHASQDTLLLVFGARASEAEVVIDRPPDEDVIEVKWFDRPDALQAVTHPSEHDRLVDALAETEAVAYRVYRDA